MTAPGRWPPLEERVKDALSRDPPGVPMADLHARLEVITGNEWIVAEALEDLVSAAVVRVEVGADGRERYLRTA